jgi:hypothetical protein
MTRRNSTQQVASADAQAVGAAKVQGRPERMHGTSLLAGPSSAGEALGVTTTTRFRSLPTSTPGGDQAAGPTSG